MDCKEPKYLHLPGEIKHLHNEDAALGREVILVEGVTDVISACQAGFAAVATLGAHGLKGEFLPRFSKCEAVYVCYDSDKAGDLGTLRAADSLGVRALMVDMPDGQDVNDFFISGKGADDLQQLLDSAKPLIDVKIEFLVHVPSNRLLTELDNLMPLLADLNGTRLTYYVNVIKERVGVKANVIKAGIKEFRENELKTAKSQHIESVEGSREEPFTDDERKEALGFLRDPDLIDRVAETLTDLGCVGEEANKLIVYLTLTSRKLDDPISLIIKGDSASGKSFIVQSVMQLFPAEEILAFTTMTPKALYHRQDSLAHKALVIFERPGAEESDYSIRTLQSEKRLIISFPVKNPDTGMWETVDHEIAGPVAYIETTTRTRIHTENETRCFSIYTDDSDEQTNRILKTLRARYLGRKICQEPNARVWQAAQTLLERKPIVIPYCDLIEFPVKPIRVRRDLQRFLSVIEVSAFLHQFQREKTVVEGVECIVASINDYAMAYGLAGSIMEQTVKGISVKAETLARFIYEHVCDRDEKTYKIREIVDSTGWDIKTVKKYNGELVKAGLVELRDSGKGRAHVFEFIRLPDEQDCILINPYDLEKRTEARKNQTKQAKLIQTDVGQVKDMIDNDFPQPDQPDRGKEEGATCT